MRLYKWRSIRDSPCRSGRATREHRRATSIQRVHFSLSTAVTKSALILYADDAVLVFAASTPQELNDALRRDFNLISDSYIDNKLTLNVKKTKLMPAQEAKQCCRSLITFSILLMKGK